MRYIPAIIGSTVLIVSAIVAGCTSDRGNRGAKEASDGHGTEEPQRWEAVVIPDGSRVTVSLDTRLSTLSNLAGYAFTATTVEPIRAGGKSAVPAGAKIHGVLRDVVASGRVRGRAQMTLAYVTLVDPSGEAHTISAVPLTLQTASAAGDDAERIAAGGVLGARRGGEADDEQLAGSDANARSQRILVRATRGHELELEVGQKLNVEMTSSLNIQVLEQ